MIGGNRKTIYCIQVVFGTTLIVYHYPFDQNINMWEEVSSYGNR